MFMFRRSFIGVLSVALSVTACSQVPTPELASQPEGLTPQFGTPNWDAGEKALVSQQTNSIYVSSGLLRLSDDGDRVESREASLRRYTPNGNVIWSTTFNAFTNVNLVDLAEDAAGNLAVALIDYDSSGASYAELLKYNVTGQKLWQLTLANVSYVESIEMTPTGEVFAVVDGGNLYKYSQSGRLLWTRQIDALAPGGPSDTDAKGNLYTVSDSSSINKYNASGTLTWTTELRKGAATYISAKELVVSQNALYVVGDKEWTLGEGEGGVIVETDAVVFKYSLGGAYRWGRSFGTKAQDQAVSVAVDGEQNVYIAAYLNSRAAFVIQKYAATGKLLEQTETARPYNGSTDVADMVVNQTDEVYLTGRTDKDLGAGYKGGNYDAFLIRLNGQGKEAWVR